MLSDIGAMTEAFHAAHDRLYGYALADGDTPVELVNIRLAAYGVTDKLAPKRIPRGRAAPGHKLRKIRLPDREGFEDVAVYDGDALPAGFRGAGPMIVETALTTALVPPGFAIEVDGYGSLILTDTGA